MIGAAYVRLMAAYNAEMNRRLYAAAATLSDAERRADCGAFWRSIMGTLSHLVWADQMWMSRFAGWPKPAVALAESAAAIDDFAMLHAERERLDRSLEEWSLGVADAWIAGEMTWWSGAAKRELSRPRAPMLVHMFNHQTHHRGQAHALLTRHGAKTGDTDLFMVVPFDAMT